MAGVPLPLSLNDLELYLASRTILIDRTEFDAAILALDDAWRDECVFYFRVYIIICSCYY